MNKKYLILALIVGFIGYSFVKNYIDSNERQRARAARENKIVEMVSKHNASRDYAEIIQNMNFSIDAQEYFLSQINQPLFFEGAIDDIVKRDNQYIIRFVKNIDIFTSKYQFLEIHFYIKCNPEVVKDIRLDSKNGSLGEYGVVALIEGADISKSHPDSEYDWDVFVVQGTCLEVEYLGGS